MIINFDDTFSEHSRTISDVNIEKNKNFDDVTSEKIIDRNDEKNDETEKINDIDCCESNFDFDFFACRMRICS